MIKSIGYTSDGHIWMIITIKNEDGKEAEATFTMEPDFVDSLANSLKGAAIEARRAIQNDRDSTDPNKSGASPD